MCYKRSNEIKPYWLPYERRFHILWNHWPTYLYYMIRHLENTCRNTQTQCKTIRQNWLMGNVQNVPKTSRFLYLKCRYTEYIMQMYLSPINYCKQYIFLLYVHWKINIESALVTEEIPSHKFLDLKLLSLIFLHLVDIYLSCYKERECDFYSGE